MPKPMRIGLLVEEVMVGHVLNLLHHTPGVVKVDLELGDTKMAKAHAKANGHAAAAPEKVKYRRFHGEITGADALIKLLKRGPKEPAAIREAFKKQGRAETSVSAQLHLLKKEGIIEPVGDIGEGYQLTKKGQDKAETL